MQNLTKHQRLAYSILPTPRHQTRTRHMTSPLNWQDFLKQANQPEDALCLHVSNPLHALVKVTGSDAESFLHAQLSNSVTGLPDGEVRLAAWCNAKGRIWTLLRYWKSSEDIILRLPADQVEDTLKRLRMFVMRSDVQLEPLDWIANQFIGPKSEVQVEQYVDSANGQIQSIPLPAAWPLYEAWCPQEIDSDLPALPQELINLPRILAGIPEVFLNQREEWIPQMLNLDRLDAIDFRKGCYPGQEIVAKLHYKGGLKQRLQLGRIEAPSNKPETGSVVTDQDGNKVGTIIDVGYLSNTCWLLVVSRLEASNKSHLFEGQEILTVEIN